MALAEVLFVRKVRKEVVTRVLARLLTWQYCKKAGFFVCCFVVLEMKIVLLSTYAGHCDEPEYKIMFSKGFHDFCLIFVA